ncbi:MAG: gamma-glutamyl-gamma-aminobutyrate hydrolase family protein [Anaerolineaceae bacterium]|nr:gamma-glutamyl-gamma-aminobutyrate hydrolase family protein [Anaerolineaceae bacterium]
MKPLIGVTTASFTTDSGWEYNRAYVAIIQAVEAAGGLPVLVPISIGDEALRDIYERLDGVLLPGGGDMRPNIYGAETNPLTDNIDDARDHVEVNLTRWAFDDDIPVFGICRGHQVVNVALGGTLIQDVPSEIGTDISHNVTVPRNSRPHEVNIDPGSRLANILGTTQIAVNSLHHQSVGVAAPDACVTAYSPDGVVEAIEIPHKKFVLSVQWHPEDLYRDDPAMKRLFKAFVEAAAGGTPA